MKVCLVCFSDNEKHQNGSGSGCEQRVEWARQHGGGELDGNRIYHLSFYPEEQKAVARFPQRSGEIRSMLAIWFHAGCLSWAYSDCCVKNGLWAEREGRPFYLGKEKAKGPAGDQKNLPGEPEIISSQHFLVKYTAVQLPGKEDLKGAL